MSDLSIKVDGQPSDKSSIRSEKLVWHGQLPVEPASLDVTYTAVGKGSYELSTSPDGILDKFDISLVAKGSDVRLLESVAAADQLGTIGRRQHVSLELRAAAVRPAGATRRAWASPRSIDSAS